MFALNVDFVGGVAHLESRAYRVSGDAEWPPHPDRVYMALVAALYRGGTPSDVELKALEWLECQDSPSIMCSKASARTSIVSYVPTNDECEMLANRKKAKALNSVVPQDSVVKYFWREAPNAEIRDALIRIADRMTYLGRSESIVSCTWSDEQTFDSGWQPCDQGTLQLRVPYVGRLKELQDCFSSGIRPTPAGWQAYAPVGGQPFPQAEWNQLLTMQLSRKVGLEETLRIYNSVRKAVLSICADQLPEWLSGHATDGSQSKSSHISIVPLADVGHRHATGSVFGVGIGIPSCVSPTEASEALAPLLRNRIFLDRVTELHPVLDARKTLMPETWTQANCRWTTVTPMTLHRWPKKKAVDELVLEALLLAGLPNPANVWISSSSRLRGGLGNRLLNAPGRYRLHATIEWAEPIAGPIILGANRYQGLGLCKAI